MALVNYDNTADRAIEDFCELYSREEVIEKVEDLVIDFLHGCCKGKIRHLITLRRDARSLELLRNGSSFVHNGDKKRIMMTTNSCRKYTAIWLVLQTAYNLLLEDRRITQREFYYMHTFFKKQSEADEAILDAGALLGIPRDSLNIIGGVKGSFCGRIFIEEGGKWIDCRDQGISGKPINTNIINLDPSKIASDARFILVIEKDGIFNRLSEDKFYNTVPCILITGKGFPDLATRAFTKKLSEALSVPVLGLCDCNPFGLSILLTYKLGSARMPLDSFQYAVDIKWLGLRPSSVQNLDLEDHVFEKFTKNDERKLQSLAQSEYIQNNLDYAEELMYWNEIQMKLELEALFSRGMNSMANFLLQQILSENYI